MSNSIELLAPAGGERALCAAVQSGADAVYLGGEKFGARSSAENFSAEDIKKWTDYCHLYGVDTHVTVNTLIKEKELDSLLEYVYQLNDACVDALIVQDLGAASLIHKALPDMVLHASTQMTVTSLDGVKYLEELGFSRVVLARELSAKEIEHIVSGANAEIEVFVHGAICMCYSGQCLMSSILGGRSGNRGRCAQPCRLPYSLVENGNAVNKSYLLSPKDMALINELKTLRNIGVSSLKIEGRLKRAEYVSAVVGIYRKYLDSMERVSESDMQELENAFSRSGFTDGYFKSQLGKNMMSHKNPGNSKNVFTEEAKARTAENANIRKIPVSISGTLKCGKPVVISIRDKAGNSIEVKGTQKAERAINRPLDKQRFGEQLIKLGGTPFAAEHVNIEADKGVIVPIKEINAVRREAAEKLIEVRVKRNPGEKIILDEREKIVRKAPEKIELTAQISTMEQAKAAVNGGIKRIYAPKDIAEKIRQSFDDVQVIIAASEIFTREEIKAEDILVTSSAAVKFYKGKKLYGDFRMNMFNSETVNMFSELESAMISPELNIGEIKELAGKTNAELEVIGYGRLPLMTMKNCPVKAAGYCQKNKRIYSLRDRKNEEFPILCTDDCKAVLINSKPVYMADKIEDLKKLKINYIRLIFTVENFYQCGKIIEEYFFALNGEKVKTPEENSFTRGHYYRGVE